MRMKTNLFIVVVIVALALSVLYGRQSSKGTEGFMDAGTGVAIGVGVLGVVVIGAFFYGIKPERVF